MANQTRTYDKTDPAAFTTIKQHLADHGIAIADGATSGIVPAPHGFMVTWAYYPQRDMLSITLDGSIFLMGLAWSSIESVVQPDKA